MRTVRGATVLVTGAGRGMGELYVRRAAAEGASKIALLDIDAEAMQKIAVELERPGLEIKTYEVDIANLKSIQSATSRISRELGVVDVLVNNAGIVRGKPFWEHDAQSDIELTMQINTIGPMWLTRELLPEMMSDRSRPKRILNIASAAGTLGNPNMSVYASSKWAMIGWSESMRLELKKKRYSHVKVTTFCPSFISTGMFAGARGPLLTPIMKPEYAVSAAWQGMLSGKAIVNRPWTVKLAMALRGILPTRAWDIVADKVFKVYSSMDKFTGRS